ncbi:hypothetical protein LOK49_LG15G00068 [Camellia lanceoleosa]|uniref:Uncharacterized protein n=1 Tax=Camellia lanceoleosa TaxID=1840588 RepID=A0ACC0F680_9ERIC|nr:hypothetical protein LOK49_LG15G00068 [Camellia lanceoleosa]
MVVGGYTRPGIESRNSKITEVHEFLTQFISFYNERYLPEPNDMLVLDIAYMIYLKFVEYPSALQIALFLDNMQYVKQVYESMLSRFANEGGLIGSSPAEVSKVLSSSCLTTLLVTNFSILFSQLIVLTIDFQCNIVEISVLSLKT